MRIGYAHVASTLALVVATSGAAYAATVITSADIKNNTIQSKDVKDGGLAAKDLSGAARKAIRGPAGKIITTTSGATSVVGAGAVTVLDLSLPAGSWALTAHVGGAHNDVDSAARIECYLSYPGGNLDFAKLRLPPNDNSSTSLVFFDISLNGAATLTSPGVVKVDCYDVGAADTGFTITGHALTAVRGQSVAVQ